MESVLQRTLITKRLIELLTELGLDLKDVAATDFGDLVDLVSAFTDENREPDTVPSKVIKSQHYLPED